jgi:serine O-acetyltransferase
MSTRFHLSAYLRADLRRAISLQGGEPDAKGAASLWLGLLAPRFAPVLLCRLASWLASLRLTPLAKLVSLVNFVIFGVEIALQADIGPGLFFPHSQGIVIGALRIGSNAVIYQGVTLGAKELDFAFDATSRPILGNDVVVGSGAKVLGGITLGDGARIGANAVVVDSVPPGCLAVGIPARIISRT